MKKYIFSSFLIIVFTIILLEIFSFVMVKLKIINFSQTPKIYTNKNFVFYPDWYNEENIWGAWRYPNKKTKHTRKCFDIEYSSNEIGARDSSLKYNLQKKYLH